MPREPIPDPLIGRALLGKYKIVRLLGEGGMGAVYLGEQPLGPTIRRVAIKTLHQHLSRDEAIRARFHREVGTLAGLEHPNTVQVFDFGTTEDGLLFIVMEFVQGQSLANVLEKDGPLAPVRVQKILAQICGSLAEAHAQGIIHRDLKPDNIVLTERAGQKDFVKVLDFGIAKRSGEEDRNEAKLTQQGMVVGTPPYMSPEQFTGQPLDARSDIYSLGIMAYELLTGQLPFEAASAWEWATLHMTAAPKAIEATPKGAALPESMRGAIMRALAKNKDQRFATVTEFQERFAGNVGPSDGELARKRPTADMPEAAPLAGERKGKTQIGEPLAMPPMGSTGTSPGLPASYPVGGTAMGAPLGPGGPGAYGAPAGGYAPPGGGYGAPVAAVPSPYDGGAGSYGHGAPNYGGVPQGPHRTETRGGKSNKGLFLGLAAALAVVSGIAIAAGAGLFSGSSSSTPPPDPFATSTVATTPTAAPTSAPTDVPTSTPLSNGAPPLSNGATPPLSTPTTPPKTNPAPTTKPTTPPAPTPTPPAPTPTPTPTPTPAPTPTPPPAPTPTPHPTPVPTPQPPRPGGGGAEPKACQTARQMRAEGKPAAMVRTYENMCRAAGGTP